MNEAENQRWRIRDRQTGQILGEFNRVADAYASVLTPGNAMWKYIFILS